MSLQELEPQLKKLHGMYGAVNQANYRQFAYKVRQHIFYVYKNSTANERKSLRYMLKRYKHIQNHLIDFIGECTECIESTDDEWIFQLGVLTASMLDIYASSLSTTAKDALINLGLSAFKIGIDIAHSIETILPYCDFSRRFSMGLCIKYLHHVVFVAQYKNDDIHTLTSLKFEWNDVVMEYHFPSEFRMALQYWMLSNLHFELQGKLDDVIVRSVLIHGKLGHPHLVIGLFSETILYRDERYNLVDATCRKILDRTSLNDFHNFYDLVDKDWKQIYADNLIASGW
ncbi:MAG: hypothetical protein AAFR81_01390 [Chloroflexota bacterium]